MSKKNNNNSIINVEQVRYLWWKYEFPILCITALSLPFIISHVPRLFDPEWYLPIEEMLTYRIMEVELSHRQINIAISAILLIFFSLLLDFRRRSEQWAQVIVWKHSSLDASGYPERKDKPMNALVELIVLIEKATRQYLSQQPSGEQTTVACMQLLDTSIRHYDSVQMMQNIIDERDKEKETEKMPAELPSHPTIAEESSSNFSEDS